MAGVSFPWCFCVLISSLQLFGKTVGKFQNPGQGETNPKALFKSLVLHEAATAIPGVSPFSKLTAYLEHCTWPLQNKAYNHVLPIRHALLPLQD